MQPAPAGIMSVFPSRTVAIEILGFDVHWYGIMYLLSFLVVYFSLPRLQRHREISLSGEQWSTVVSWAVVGVILGGRLGYVLFYGLPFYLQNPLEIFAVWHGGMSSHGGMLGLIAAMLLVCRKYSIPFLALADIAVIPAAIGLALGRMGNFINLELYGTVTTLPWGIAIPGVEGLRHPTQLYAVAKDLAIAIVCFVHVSRIPYKRNGQTFAVFLMMYAVLRFTVEYLRVQDHPGFDASIIHLTIGQMLTIPVFIAGVIVWQRAPKKA